MGDRKERCTISTGINAFLIIIIKSVPKKPTDPAMLKINSQSRPSITLSQVNGEKEEDKYKKVT